MELHCPILAQVFILGQISPSPQQGQSILFYPMVDDNILCWCLRYLSSTSCNSHEVWTHPHQRLMEGRREQVLHWDELVAVFPSLPNVSGAYNRMLVAMPRGQLATLQDPQVHA